ncbi:hypothetical protein ACFYYB_35260 [Streptomyces sp. NPDC002886]|uniref:hypothetical protein n=1 Tax=Streptomyces sp. NPDC002886 TaxID=3364667 RepID=UPI0036CFE511
MEIMARPVWAGVLSFGLVGSLNLLPGLARSHDVDGDSEWCFRKAQQCPGDCDRLDDAHATLGKKSLNGFHSITLQDWSSLLDQSDPECGLLGA